MAYTPTSLLSLPIITTGSESGLWGDVTNNGLTQYLDIAIAGRNALTSANFTAGALTLANTAGTNSTTNIAATSAQYSTLYVSSLATNSTITAPSSNRNYLVINADSTYTLTVKASGQTGITFSPGQSGLVAFNGTDYALVGTIGPTVPVARGGTNATATPTAGAVAYGTGSAYAFTAAGTAGYVLQSNGSSAPTWAAALPATSGGTGATTYTTGDVIYASATNTLSKLGIGSSGQVLSVSGGVPAWATPSAGALVFLTSQSLSGASSYTITTGISSTYNDYFFIITDLLSSSGLTHLRVQKGGSVQTATYSGRMFFANNAVVTSTAPIDYHQIMTSVFPDLQGCYGYLLNANSTTANSQFLMTHSITPEVSNSRATIVFSCSTQATAAAVGGINIYSSANFTATFKLYGIAKS